MAGFVNSTYEVFYIVIDISLFYLLKDRLIANCKISKYNFPIKVFENYEFYKKIF